MVWKTFYTGTQQDIINATAQIDLNCNFPDGYTQTWAIPKKAYEQDFWFIPMPSPEGYKNIMHSFTQEEMIFDVVNVSEQESQRNWWPPFPPSKKSI